MAYFHTCQTCAVKPAECSARAKLSAAIAGLGIGSVKHRCADFIPLYTPGSAILVQAYAWIGGGAEPEDAPPLCWFRGRFIRHVGPKLLVFVEPKTPPEDGPEGWAFEPKDAGFIKASRYRVKPSDWAQPVSVEACRWCAAITTLGQPCGRDPNYTPASSCQAHQLALANEKAA